MNVKQPVSTEKTVEEKLTEAIEFIEKLEALTTDKKVQSSIQTFMRENGYWPN